MAQDPKIIYKTTDPRIQKILDTDKSVNMTPGASEIESGIERNKMLTQQKNIAETSKNINDSTIVKPPVIKATPTSTGFVNTFLGSGKALVNGMSKDSKSILGGKVTFPDDFTSKSIITKLKNLFKD